MWRLVMAAVVGFLSVSELVRADEKDIGIDQLPKAVVTGIKAKYPGAKLVSAEKETQGDKVLYEVNLKHNDRAVELLLTPDGKIVSVEQPIAAKDLPKMVTQAIRTRFPKATVKSAEETVKDEKATYAVLLENNVMIGKEKQNVLMQLTSAGDVTGWQKRIAISDLPRPVTDALAKKYKETPIVRANEASQAGKISYLVSLRSADSTSLAVLEPDGKILKEYKSKNKK